MDVSKLILREGLRRGLRIETIHTYSFVVNKFLRIYHKEPHQVTKDDVERYITQLIKWNRAANTINVHLHALRFFYEKVLGKKLTVKMPLVKTRKSLPECLTQSEINDFFSVIKNSKHKLITIFCYGSGFRVSEVVKLKVKDLNLEKGHGWVRDGKGGKDRMFIIAEKLKNELLIWIKGNNLKYDDWLFAGSTGKHYSESSVREIVKRAKREAGISKNISPHTLRHSFATHLLENGYSLIEVNRLLGHNRMETTMVYTHLANPKMFNIKSPYDNLNQKEMAKKAKNTG